MSEYESNDIDINYGEQEEQNEEENENENENEEDNYQNNSNYNDTQNFNNTNNSNNYKINPIKNNNINMNNKMQKQMNQNQNEEEQEQDQDQDQDQEQENNSNSNNNVSTNQNNKKNSKRNTNNSKKNQITTSQDNNGTIKNEGSVIEESPDPEILYEEFFNYYSEKRNSLNIKECKNAMRSLGLVVTEREIMDFFEIKEKTGKERINLDDFKAICNKKLNETSNNIEELQEAFEMLDPEKTGFVNSMVLRHQMKVFKPKITEEEINQILCEFGQDKNGNINYREYINDLKS
jgi:Ca2+-binding EF-hand superfamily protein